MRPSQGSPSTAASAKRTCKHKQYQIKQKRKHKQISSIQKNVVKSFAYSNSAIRTRVFSAGTLVQGSWRSIHAFQTWAAPLKGELHQYMGFGIQMICSKPPAAEISAQYSAPCRELSGTPVIFRTIGLQTRALFVKLFQHPVGAPHVSCSMFWFLVFWNRICGIPQIRTWFTNGFNFHDIIFETETSIRPGLMGSTTS